MTIDNLARRLDAAADELAGMRAELARHEIRFDADGRGAADLTASLRVAWERHTDLTAGLAADLTGLSASVSAAAGNYRTTDREAM